LNSESRHAGPVILQQVVWVNIHAEPDPLSAATMWLAGGEVKAEIAVGVTL
jgi:hypothetical protein